LYYVTKQPNSVTIEQKYIENSKTKNVNFEPKASKRDWLINLSFKYKKWQMQKQFEHYKYYYNIRNNSGYYWSVLLERWQTGQVQTCSCCWGVSGS